MIDEARLLRECFSLVENPFNPKRGPNGNPDFQQLGISLSKPLDIFRVAELEHYFARVGAFNNAVQEIDDFFQRNNYPVGGAPAPAFLIEGVSGVGRSTLAFLLGHKIKVRNADQATFSTVQVPTDHWGRILFTIKKKLKMHADAFQIPNCDAAFNQYTDQDINPQDPSANYLTQIFNDLAQCLVAPPLVLVVESINWDRRSWMTDLSTLLGQLNVVLIFLTDDPRIYNLFPGVPKSDGFRVRLAPFDRQMAEQFLTSRLEIFRCIPTPPDKTGLFPFDSSVLDQIYALQRQLSIKYLETIFRGAFTTKLNELLSLYKSGNGNPPRPQIPRESLLIPYKDVTKTYSAVFQSANPGN